MKKFKIVIWLLIIAFIGLVIYQNKDVFMAKRVFHLDLWAKAWTTPAIPEAAVFVGFFAVGLLVAFLFSLPGRLKAGKTIRSLNDTIRSQRSELAAMKSEIDAIKEAAPPPAADAPAADAPPAPPEQDPPATPS